MTVAEPIRDEPQPRAPVLETNWLCLHCGHSFPGLVGWPCFACGDGVVIRAVLHDAVAGDASK